MAGRPAVSDACRRRRLLQYDGLLGRYVPLARSDAAMVAAAVQTLPLPR
jgi:hypothetical protein